MRQRAAHLPPALRDKLPAQSHTVHRLLGAHPGGFRHHAGHPLAIDVLVVDEASMLDLALATRLLEAVPGSARLILLGDKDQLAAVESGAVFAELSADPALGPDCVQALAELCGVPAELITPGAAARGQPAARQRGLVHAELPFRRRFGHCPGRRRHPAGPRGRVHRPAAPSGGRVGALARRHRRLARRRHAAMHGRGLCPLPGRGAARPGGRGRRHPGLRALSCAVRAARGPARREWRSTSSCRAWRARGWHHRPARARPMRVRRGTPGGR